MKFDFTKEPGKKLLNRNMQKNSNPLISIVTPFFNAGSSIEQTYNSVLNQTFPFFEWIIVDDESTNKNDIAYLRKLASTDPRISIYEKKNSGPAGARNYGVMKASTDIIVFLDADDLIEPTFLELNYMALYFNPRAAWSYTDSLGFGNQEYLWKVPFDDEKLKKENFLTVTGAVRKAYFEKVKGFDEIQKYAYEDWHFWLKIMESGGYPVHIDNLGFWYRRGDDGIYSITSRNKIYKHNTMENINKVSENIKSKIKAKEFCCNGKLGEFQKPKLSDFKLKVFNNHSKTNIMMLLPWLEMGGADLFNLDLVRMINRDKYEMSILTTVKAENTWKQKFSDYVTDLFELPNFLDMSDYAEFISYFIKSREIDVLFLSNSYYGYYLIPWLKVNFPSLIIVDYIHMEEWYWRNGGFARTSGALTKFIHKTYVCNERTRNVMINNFDVEKDKVKTVYIGVDSDYYKPETISNNTIKEQLGISLGRPCVLFPCRIAPQKRPFLMLEIAEKCKEKIPKIAFIVVGDGPDLEELIKKTIEMSLEDTVYYAGRQEDMRPYYDACDVTLICSIKEGLALTAYESCAMGKPVITSDVGGQKELIDSMVGRVIAMGQNEADDFCRKGNYPLEEVDPYVNALVDILENHEKYIELSKNCRKRIVEGFSTELMIKYFEVEFERLIQEKVDKVSDTFQNELSEAIAIDYVSLYVEYEKLDREINEVWQSRVWFEERYNTLVSNVETNTSDNQTVGSTSSVAEIRLNEIYNMRTWKVVRIYQKFMEDNKIGRGVYKVIRKVLG